MERVMWIWGCLGLPFLPQINPEAHSPAKTPPSLPSLCGWVGEERERERKREKKRESEREREGGVGERRRTENCEEAHSCLMKMGETACSTESLCDE